jgi:GNAT superfamily N-acetyltransferase
MHAVRPFRVDDAPSLSRVMRASVAHLTKRAYDAAQIEAWLSRCPTGERLAAKMGDGRYCLVAADASDEPVAFGDLEANGHVDYLYVAPEAAGLGTASEILAGLVRAACERNIGRLFVEASAIARGTFARAGFDEVSRRQIWVDQTPIHNFAMEKVLVEGAAPVARAPVAAVREWVARFNAADAAGLAAMYREDAVNHQVVREPVEGRDAIRAMFEGEFRAAEMTCLPDVLHDAGETAILEWRDPKGRRGCGFFTVHDGLISLQRGYWDRLSFGDGG